MGKVLYDLAVLGDDDVYGLKHQLFCGGGGGDDDDEGATFMVLLWDKLGKPWGWWTRHAEDVRGDGTKPWFHLFQLSHDKAPVPVEFCEGRVSGWLDASIGLRYQLAIELATFA